MKKHFQQRMSWLPYRWRTQRNAIRNANCKIQWVIKTLNAACTSLGEYVCWSVCLSPPHPNLSLISVVLGVVVGFNWSFTRWIVCLDDNKQSNNRSFSNSLVFILGEGRDVVVLIYFQKSRFFLSKSVACYFPFRTSNQSRIPAEFKHITRRRKRN